MANTSTTESPTEADDDIRVTIESAADCGLDRDSASPKQVQLPLRPVPQPIVNGGSKVWDITERFTKASQALEIGQLVKDEYFTLFESIGALEIMDPKMDSGFLQPGETLEENYDALRTLLPEEVLGIMDQLLCYEMAWHQGYPLSQTLFTSVYIDRLLWPEPRSLEEAQFYRGNPGSVTDALQDVLRAYCLGIIKCCDFVIAKITSRDYFEEEDFCTHTYNRSLFTKVPHDFVLHELEIAEEILGTDVDNIDETVKAAIHSRLEFRRNFLIALSPDYSINFLDKYWPPVSALLPAIESSHELARVVPEAFSTKIQRRLTSTVPPRPIVELEFKDAFAKLKQLCEDCAEATKYTFLNPTPEEYQSFLWAFASRKVQPSAYARSYLAGFVFAGDNDVFEGLLRDDLAATVFPEDQVLDPINWTIDAPRNPLFPKDKRLQMASIIDDFTNRTTQNYLEFWTALCQNRCRMRRMLCHSLLAFDQLQSDASILDDELQALTSDLQQYPLTTWVYHLKLRQMEWIIQLGFEQDIYLPDELAGMYLFLAKVAETRNRLLITLLEFWEQRQKRLEKGKKADVEKAAIVQEGKAYIEALLAEAIGTEELSAALSSLYALLSYLHLLPQPPRPFSTPELRYELRTKPFALLQPVEIIAFNTLTTHIHPFGPPESPTSPLELIVKHVQKAPTYQPIDASIKRAKDAFAKLKKLGPKAASAEGVKEQWASRVQGCLFSCVAAGVAVAGLRAISGELKQTADAKGRVRVEGVAEGEGEGKRYHEWWVVPKLVKL
ncbi:Mak10-domain-containing protein [Lophium mytilinum]|uniref:Mak10-domain-containing protein n=1 Tax=Lophium mytilinum TaxID=390894 RepID=A0A6A6QKC7_9PEZI|nr:Mak10-domain-containing protein [Lophium mytilinum]